MKLHRRSKALDAYMDDRMELSTTRIAWNEITDNVERGASASAFRSRPWVHRRGIEAGTHQAFLDSLGSHVIDPLNKVKVRGVFFGVWCSCETAVYTG